MPRVIVHFMHEYEAKEAHDAMPAGEATEGFMFGELDEKHISDLRAKGLIVQPADIAIEPKLPQGLDLLRGKMMALSSWAGVERAAVSEPDMTRGQFFLMWLKGPLLEKWRAEFIKLEVGLLEAYPSSAYKVRLEPPIVQKVAGLPFVARLQVLGGHDAAPFLGLAKNLVFAGGPARAEALRILCFDLLLHEAADMPKVRDWLNERHIPIAGAKGRKMRVYLAEDGQGISEIPSLPEVASFEEYVPPRLHNDRARALLQIDAPAPAASLPQTGAGQIIAVADTGIDDSHPDFTGRILGAVALGRPGDYSDPHGHGTHVAGSALGDGHASAGAYRGVASGAQLFFQSLLDGAGKLGGLPLNLGDLFAEAYVRGARIHNNSWGSATASRYTINAAEVDDFVAGHRDMLIVISAGNEGTAAIPRTNSAAGFVDWLSIGSPASCKNALTVGASRSDRTSGGFAASTYGALWPRDFPDAPIAKERVSGNTQSLAAFSSRGPCDDRRIKPDVVAPGTDIVSARSKLAPAQSYWSEYPGNTRYAFMGGTSMAAPLVAGCAALVREYYSSLGHQPSAALVKATLVNGTVRLTGADAMAPAPGEPNYHQGFGGINMVESLPNPRRPSLRISFVDSWNLPDQVFGTTGQRFRYTFSLPAGVPLLRVCLAYTDLPARGLQNNVNLFLQLPTGQKIMGNAQLPNSLNIPDPDNNVECVRLANPPAGYYTLQLTATNLLRGPQDFALVVAADNLTGLTRI